ncbi:hypothetical protein K438DRAFT_1782071 [Mycena galopus ATCC 62051]|nr:hypothetical protein K438DRAFT_1782071 [Mycena galopus ATCC 62051]
MRPSLNIPALALSALAAGAVARAPISRETSNCASGLHSGTYQIRNSATSTLLRSGGPRDPIFVTYANDDADPGPYGLWNVESTGRCTFTVYNVGLDRPIALNHKGEIGIGDVHPVALTILAAGENLFNIGVAHEDKFWTVDPNSVVSTANPEPESEGQERLWEFKGIGACPVSDIDIDEPSQARFQICTIIRMPVPNTVPRTLGKFNMLLGDRLAVVASTDKFSSNLLAGCDIGL